MRTRNWMVRLLSVAALTLALGEPAARAEEEAPSDPTRGGWDGFLDPLRAGEDWLVDHSQKPLEERTKIHAGFGIDKSWMWNFNDPASGINSLHSLDPDHDSASLDFAQLSLLRPSDGFIPGFGLKLDAGRIAKRSKADWDGDGVLAVGDTFEKNDFDVQEAYLTLDVPKELLGFEGLSLKGGKFVTLLGAEVIEPWANYNFSRSFLFGFAIPFTHVGGLVSYKVTDNVSLTGGVIEGWDIAHDNNNAPSGIANVTWILSDVATLAANGIYGPEQTGRNGPKRGIVDLVATVKPLDRLTLLLNYDYGHESDIVGGTRPAHWQGFAAVANYDWTDRFSTAFRGEWFEDAQGIRTGVGQTLWETTLDAKYRITQHLYGRLEFRHDESNKGDVFAAGDTKLLAGQDIVGFEFGYLFN